MSHSYYEGKIKVVGIDLMCFRVNPHTLEPEGPSHYDPWAWTDPEVGPIETIDILEWQIRRQQHDRHE